MQRVHGADVADELSEDESDTEVEIAPPSEQRLREIFALPAGSCGGDAKQQSPANHLKGAAEPAGVYTRGVAPERVLPLDLESELAQEDSAMQANHAEEPREWLRDKFAALNKFVDSRFQLSST